MPVPARHRVGRRTLTTGPGGQDLSGNPTPGTPVPTTAVKKAIAIYQRGTDVPVSADYLDRHINELTVLVPGPSVWKHGDVMMLWGKVQGDAYVGGTAYKVDGDPADWPGGSPVRLPRGVGVTVNVKRVSGATGVT